MINHCNAPQIELISYVQSDYACNVVHFSTKELHRFEQSDIFHYEHGKKNYVVTRLKTDRPIFKCTKDVRRCNLIIKFIVNCRSQYVHPMRPAC